ncbi:MAG: hypothetical protein HQL16_03945 [Candidatus Omnitrophica bacterium]|nr:hypothetical protein [Candidatus Omnitrophota bacterium]
MTNDEINFLLDQAILAPSGDNWQPWKFILPGNGTIELRIDFDRRLPFWDEDPGTLYLSAGAVIENIRLAAQHIGYALKADYCWSSDNPARVAVLSFQLMTSPSSASDEALFAGISRRVTNRDFYNPFRFVPAETFLKINEIAKTLDGFHLLWITRQQKKDYCKLVHFMMRADRLWMGNRSARLIMARSIRYSAAEIESMADGMDVRVMGMNPFDRLMIPLIFSPDPRLEWIHRLGIAQAFSLRTGLQLHTSSACGILLGPEGTPLDFVRAGELMERVWIALNQEGIALQPMCALPILVANVKSSGQTLISAREKEIASKLWQDFSEFIHSHSNGKKALFMFRAGYAAAPKVRLPRRKRNSFLGG